MHPDDLRSQLLVSYCPHRRRPRPGGVVGARGELQHAADRLDPELVTVIIDVGDHLRVRPSSSVAKKSDADFKISFARRNSRFSRSNSFSRTRSSELKPGRRPSSTSALRTQARSVSGVQPIFPATDEIVAHNDSYSRYCSNTSRTAHWRTSGAYLHEVLDMTPSSQGLKPATFPERFTRQKRRRRRTSARQGQACCIRGLFNCRRRRLSDNPLQFAATLRTLVKHEGFDASVPIPVQRFLSATLGWVSEALGYRAVYPRFVDDSKQ